MTCDGRILVQVLQERGGRAPEGGDGPVLGSCDRPTSGVKTLRDVECTGKAAAVAHEESIDTHYGDRTQPISHMSLRCSILDTTVHIPVKSIQ